MLRFKTGKASCRWCLYEALISLRYCFTSSKSSKFSFFIYAEENEKINLVKLTNFDGEINQEILFEYLHL